LLAQAGAAQDNGGVVGYEVFSTSTPGGGGTMESQGLTGERTAWFITHVAPGNAGVVNMVVTYYDSKESLDKAKEKEKEKEKKKKGKKTDEKKPDPPSVPTYDPRFYEYKDGKLVPKTQNSSGSRAATDGNRQTASVEGLVVPDNVYDRQPFSFAAPQIASEVVKIETVEGVVVQTTSTDEHGRVFLNRGLPSGFYPILSSNNQLLGKIEIRQRADDALQHVSQAMQLQNPPQTLKMSDPFSLNGHGFSPNCGDMKVSLTASGKTEAPIILAATEDQLKLAPAQQLQPGVAQLTVTNSTTGQSIDTNLLLYTLHAELKRQTIHSHGDQTQLVINTRPENQPLKVKVNVASGPVDFGHGRKEMEGVTSNGQAIFPVCAGHGSGPFQLTWEVAELPRGLAQARNEKHTPGASLPAVSEDLFPDGYISSPRFGPYENLLNAKRNWLERKILRHQDAIDEEKKMLNAPGNEDNRATIQARIDENTAEVNAAKDELKVLDGKDDKAKKALVKKNVEKWIRELEARIRELHQIEEKEKAAAKDANNRQDRERHEANAKDASDEAKEDAKEATDLRSDLEKAKL